MKNQLFLTFKQKNNGYGVRVRVIFLISICANILNGQIQVSHSVKKSNSDKEVKNSIRKTNDTPTLSLNLDGAFSGFVKNKEDLETPITGSIYAQFNGFNKFNFALGYSLNKKEELLINSRQQFYTSIITPQFSGQSFTGVIEYQFKSSIGLNTTCNVGFNDWSIDTSRFGASPIAWKFLFYYLPLSEFDIEGENNVDVELSLGPTFRKLSTNTSDEFKKMISYKYGFFNKWMWGMESNIKFSFNSLTFYFNPIWIFSNKNISDFPNNGIYTLGVNVTGDALKFKFKPKN